MATDGTHDDPSATLSELERKLVALEDELQSVAAGPTVWAHPGDAEEADRQDPGVRIEDLRGEIAELMRFRDHLASVARSLLDEYDGLVARLKRATPGSEFVPAPIGGSRSGAPAAPRAAEPAGPAPSEDIAESETAPEAPAPADTAPDPSDAGDQIMEGGVVLDAGPFVDITTLQSFEQALAGIEGAEDVYVRSFEGNRALIDVRLSNPVPLVRLLREKLSLPITARETGEGRLSVELTADSHGT